MDHTAPRGRPERFFASRWNVGLIIFIAIAGFYRVTEHQAHVFGVLPFLLILACPLMHLFMHGSSHGHGGHGGGSSPAELPGPTSADEH